MHLGVARICLDCDEIHDQMECPNCASESFAFLSRWVAPSAGDRAPAKPSQAVQQTDAQEKLETYRDLIQADTASRSGTGTLARRFALVVATLGLVRWGWQRTRPR